MLTIEQTLIRPTRDSQAWYYAHTHIVRSCASPVCQYCVGWFRCKVNARILLVNPKVPKIVPRICRYGRPRNMENPKPHQRPACSHNAGGMRSRARVRVWRQYSNCPANWSSWWLACNGVLSFMIASKSWGAFHKDDCRRLKIEIHAGLSEAHQSIEARSALL